VTDDTAHGGALRPLWSLSGGAVVAASGALWVTEPGPAWVRTLLMVLGVSALLAAFIRRSRDRGPADIMVFGVAALAMVGGRGLEAAVDRLSWESMVATPGSVIRARVVLTGGWAASRWGVQTPVVVLDAVHREHQVGVRRRARLEIRSATTALDLPNPGDVVEVLARPAGDAAQPLLIVPSRRLVRPTGVSRLLPRMRNHLALSVIAAAGTDVVRIRSAELAAALALGRRDLVPIEQRDRWRRSGFAHLLAVSGLHVGIVGGTFWLLAVLLGAGPRSARLIAMVLIPSYAVLAGASPSAMRAALMGIIYLGARFLGRAVLPMAAVLLTVVVLLIYDPAMIAEPGFQLTVVITAALIRWVPPVAAALRGPLWVRGAIAVPCVAQCAAAPLVAWHFRSFIPGALIANLLALPLLSPTVLVSVLATLLAPFSSGGAALALRALQPLVSLLDLVGRPARMVEMIAPGIPILAVLALVAAGWLALQTGRSARWAAAVWIAVLAAVNLRLILDRPKAEPRFTILPVSDGTAVVAAAGRDVVLADAGRFVKQAAVLVADTGHRRLRILMASHSDEDHIGGAVHILRTLQVERLVLPKWMVSDVESVPLLRAARAAGTRVVPVARGSVLSAGSIELSVKWPPARNPPRDENERSLVVSVDLAPGSALITSDIGRTTERRLGRATRLECDVLVVPHHGSRGGTSSYLLDAADPKIALIPASPGNTHGHPHREVMARLAARGIATRMPTRNEAAGARWNGERWQAYP